MKKFFIDLGEVYNNYWGFLKNHWLGYGILCAMIIGIEAVIIYKERIDKWFQDRLETKFNKNDELE